MYLVKCVDCEAEYVGKTSQYIDARIILSSQHIDARTYQHKMVKDGQQGLTKSHITEHTQRLRYKNNWPN